MAFRIVNFCWVILLTVLMSIECIIAAASAELILGIVLLSDC